MPIYEYRCRPCGKLSSFFTRSINSALEPVCGHCQSREMVRRMSSFAMGKTLRSVHEQHPMGSGPSSPDFYSDPRNIGRNVEESFSRFGVEMPNSVRESIDAARQGEMPKGLDT
jgi:putative FmdB family regulatory protein